MSETLYICKSCEGVYMIPVTQCDCMPEKQEFTEMVMIEPEELERLRTENVELSEGLTTAYMCGYEKGKEAANAELKQELDRLRDIYYASSELFEVAQLRGDNDLPHPADDPLLWTARMQEAWDELEYALHEQDIKEGA